jgi:hypothetical protein
VGTVQSAVELATGRDFIAGEAADRRAAMVGLVPGGKVVANGAKGIIKAAAPLARQTTILGSAAGAANALRRNSPVSGLPGAGSIPRSLGAMSQAEKLARKFKLNVNSPTTQQVLNSLDASVSSFVGKYRQGKILKELPREVLDMTIEDALSHSTKVRKLLIDGRFVK